MTQTLDEAIAEIDPKDPLCVVDGPYKAEWYNAGEGWSGDWDPDDPNDTNLYRFDCYVWQAYCFHPEGGDPEGWVDPGNASYCTRMPVDSPPWMLRKALEAILREFKDAYEGGGSYKKVLEWMSWIGPQDFEGERYAAIRGADF